MSTSIAAAAERQKTAQQTIERYRAHLYEILPSHLAGMEKTWMRVAFGAIRKNPKLIDACVEDPDSVINALMEAGRLGLEPGTDEYYLTPRKRKLPNGQYVASVLGIVGYQGEVELIYRAGAVTSVVCDLVYERDVFVWRPGALDREIPPRWEGPQRQPYHEADWFGDRGGDGAPRHGVKGAYAYCIMIDGSVSQVVIVNQRRIDRAMAASRDSDKDSSPWQTDYPSMVLKTGAHDIAKWVPTSAEYRQRRMATSEREPGVAQLVLPAGNPARLTGTPTPELEAGDSEAVVETMVTEVAEVMELPVNDGAVTDPEPVTQPEAVELESGIDWDAAIREAVTGRSLSALTDLWESASYTEPENTELAQKIRVAVKEVQETLAAIAHEPESQRDTLRKQLFSILGKAGIKDTDPGGRERRLLICSRLLTIMPVIGSTKDLSDLQLGQINAALLRLKEQGQLESTLTDWTVSES